MPLPIDLLILILRDLAVLGGYIAAVKLEIFDPPSGKVSSINLFVAKGSGVFATSQIACIGINAEAEAFLIHMLAEPEDALGE